MVKSWWHTDWLTDWLTDSPTKPLLRGERCHPKKRQIFQSQFWKFPLPPPLGSLLCSRCCIFGSISLLCRACVVFYTIWRLHLASSSSLLFFLETAIQINFGRWWAVRTSHAGDALLFWVLSAASTNHFRSMKSCLSGLLPREPEIKK